MESDLLALHWMEHASFFSQAIGNLRTKTTYTDATLACEGHFFPVHKFVLSTCSQYFNAIFEWTPCINPVVVINNITCKELEALLDFMYIGEVSVKESLIPDVMRAAECLRIRGLSIVDDENAKSQLKSKNKSDSGGPPRKRKRTSVPKRKASATASDIPTSHQPPESSSHLSPSPSSASGHHYDNEGNMNHTENHAPELSSPQYSEKHPSGSQNHDFNQPQAPVQNNAPSHFLPRHRSSSPQLHLSVQPLQSSAPSVICQHNQISPSHETTLSHSSALDLSSHDQKPEVSMNSRKMELGESKSNTTHAHNTVSSDEIPDLLDSLVDMRPLYDTKPEPGDEVATFHAVEPSDNLYEFTEDLPSASATPSQQEVRYQKGPAISGSSKKSDQNSTEVNPALKCSFCGKQCLKKDSLTRHMRTHTKEPYTCKQCPFTSQSYKAFIEHKRKEHASLHRCTACEFTTTRYDNFRRHMASHEKPHKCSECKFSTNRLQNLQKHIKNKHEKK